MAEESYRAYRNLVEAPGFLTFFRQGTPIEGIEHLQIGFVTQSTRDGSRRIEQPPSHSLGFAWTQNRVMSPAWYGLGTALEKAPRLDQLQLLYREWPFFTAVMDNAVLAW